MKILVTGGCGFIGSNFIDYLLSEEVIGVDLLINIDKQTYAGKGKNIEHLKLDNHPKYKFIKADIADKEAIDNIFKEYTPDLVFNFAAESHVDRSIASSNDFVDSNVVGTINLLDASKRFDVKKFIQISTDEVYGSIDNGSFNERSQLNSSSPYSASKASAEHFALSYFKTHKLPVIITRSANNYGKYQFPEKLLPLFITNLIDKKKVPLMWSVENPGLNVRDWLNVNDNCRAIWFVSEKGFPGEIYNIPGDNERTNIEMTNMLLSYFKYGDDMIEKVLHRKGHDFRYSISGDKLKDLGFVYQHKDLYKEINELCKWYKENESWWRPLKDSKKIKGIILAGGKATRLYPITKTISKQLLSVYDKPMIYYPLSTLMLAGIKDIMIISTPVDLPRFKDLLGDGSSLGINICYKVQENPRGLPDAFIVAKDFIGTDKCCMILGDNIFYGNGLKDLLTESVNKEKGATVFCYEVKDPERYGVVEFDSSGNAISLEEKPKNPRSNYAVVGIYFYDNDVVKYSESLTPSARGELEIMDLNRKYLEKSELDVKIMCRGFAWLDTGTFSSLLEASNFVKTIEERQGLKIACIEETAYRMGFIDTNQLKKLAESYKNSGYGDYLLSLIPKGS